MLKKVLLIAGAAVVMVTLLGVIGLVFMKKRSGRSCNQVIALLLLETKMGRVTVFKYGPDHDKVMGSVPELNKDTSTIEIAKSMMALGAVVAESLPNFQKTCAEIEQKLPEVCPNIASSTISGVEARSFREFLVNFAASKPQPYDIEQLGAPEFLAHLKDVQSCGSTPTTPPAEMMPPVEPTPPGN